MEHELKAIAMYLPQYHNVEENNIWWGEGFTDWRAMDDAKPLFESHNQPKRPLNDNRYDLLDKGTFKWQAGLMKKYGIYGLCIYHYYFKDGRKILEKPAENLLKWNDIDIPFCFCWANESWVCSWSNVSNSNVWASRYEKDVKQYNNGMLLEQKYGDKDDWVKHYDYLRDFFKDSRYILMDNKPILVLYKPMDITCLSEMITCWNELAIKDGFNGIYIIGAWCDSYSKKIVDAELQHEPSTTITRQFSARFTNEKYPHMGRVLEYDDVWRASLGYCYKSGKVFWGGFSNYDDTPRRSMAGMVVYGDTPDKFKQYLTELYAKNAAYGNEYVFINAWNEWGEGMYLEPDAERKYGFLEAFAYAKEHYFDYIDIYKNKKDESKELSKILEETLLQKERFQKELLMMKRWMQIKQQGISIVEYIKAHYGTKVAIYGMSDYGKLLVGELEGTDVKVVYGIDKNAEGINMNITIYKPEEHLPEVDVVIVTAVHVYDEVRNLLKKNSAQRLISLESVIMNVC